MANIISIFRFLLVYVVAFLLFSKNPMHYIIALVLTILAFALDGLDGWVARKLNETSKLGAVLDILGDRIVENTYWILFAALGWLPVAFPLIAMTRSFIVDSLRSVALQQGYTAFGEKSLQSDKYGYLICCSKETRIAYAVSKAVAFVLMIWAEIPNLNHLAFLFLRLFATFFAIVAILFCVLRGLPVLFESKKLFAKD